MKSRMRTTLTKQPADAQNFGEIRHPPWESLLERLVDEGELEETYDVSTILDDSLLTEVNDWARAEIERDVETWMEENLGVAEATEGDGEELHLPPNQPLGPALEQVRSDTELVQHLSHRMPEQVFDRLGAMVEGGHRRQHRGSR